MAKFAMYVINLEDGVVVGSNDSDEVREYIKNPPDTVADDFLVIHSTSGQVQTIDGTAEEIEELKVEEKSEEDDGDDDDN